MSGAAFAVEPLANAHAHNDYWHERPLFDALDLGFTSVEADIFVVDGKALVGHDRQELKPERTLESLYLEPLDSPRQRKRWARARECGNRFFLLVDIKSDPQEAYSLLHEMLSKYADIADRRGSRRGAAGGHHCRNFRQSANRGNGKGNAAVRRSRRALSGFG